MSQIILAEGFCYLINYVLLVSLCVSITAMHKRYGVVLCGVVVCLAYEVYIADWHSAAYTVQATYFQA
jgi:hypothetical protein